MNIFVTGTTGLLGTNVIIKLLKDGYFVTALVRKKGNYLGQKNENLRLIEGDLFSDVSLYLDGISCFIHIAAETRQDLLTYEDYKKINGDAVVHLFSQAEACKVERFLFVSTANTLGFGSLEKLGNEKTVQQYPFTHSFYAQSKLETENYLLQNKKTTAVVILNPTFMIGAYDYKPSSGKIIFWAWKKKLIFYPKGGKNFVHVEDVADGVIGAVRYGENGEKYLLAHENFTYKEFFRKVNIITQQNPMMIPVPDSVLFFLGLLGDFLRKCKVKTNLCSVNMKALRINNFYSNKKSVDDFAIKYQPIEKAIDDAVTFFRLNKIK